MGRAYLIKHGTVVDGTGAPPFAADVRVRGDRIVKISPSIDRDGRERIIDATGCYVTPGFFENHNHFDAPMWWMPTMEPMPGYGVTTSINGNCGFSAAPIHQDLAVRKEMVDIFSFFEDVPEKPFLNQLPWDWRKWSEYKASLQRNVKLPVNFGAFVGHIAIRLAVMGLEAWDRVAAPAEIEEMCDHLRDALNAGALGLSSNLLDHDRSDRPIPTLVADDAEFDALAAVLALYPGRTLQVIVDNHMRQTGHASTQRMAALARRHKIRIQIAGGVPTLAHQGKLIETMQSAHDARKAAGEDNVWVSYHHVTPTVTVNFIRSLSFAQSNNYVWNEIIEAADTEAKLALLADPAWRARARESWDKVWPTSLMSKPHEIFLFESETFAGPTGLSLADYQQTIGAEHHSDALAEWLLENGIGSELRLGEVPKDTATMQKLFLDPQALGNLADSGAHGKMFCGIGDNVVLLSRYVRDLKQLKIEDAVHILTGKSAGHFGFLDRGLIKEGMKADIVVFNLDEIERRPEKKIWDVPDGEGGRTYRYTRDPAPMRLTMVNGLPTFDQSDFTGFFPGEHIVPLASESLLQAAE